MNKYQKRRIEFRQIQEVNDWKIKVYTLTYKETFQTVEILSKAVEQLSKWLEEAKSLEFETYNVGFLMVHEGKDSIWSILHWWLGENMLRSLTFATPLNGPTEFELKPQKGGMVCVWELEIIDFERHLWIENILKKSESPDFENYLKQYLDGEY